MVGNGYTSLLKLHKAGRGHTLELSRAPNGRLFLDVKEFGTYRTYYLDDTSEIAKLIEALILELKAELEAEALQVSLAEGVD